MEIFVVIVLCLAVLFELAMICGLGYLIYSAFKMWREYRSSPLGGKG